MFTLTNLTLLATAMLGLTQAFPIAKATTNVQYCLPGFRSDTCGLSVGSGTLQAGQCYNITNSNWVISQLSNRACTFTLYSGSTTCDGSEIYTTPIAKGSGSVCIDTGVEDGGKYYHGSGKWTC